MKALSGPRELRRRRILGASIAGCGALLLGYQLWRLVVFLEGGQAPAFDFGGLGQNLVLALLGVAIGVIIGLGWQRRQAVEKPDERHHGTTIEGEATHVRDDR